MKKEIKKFVLTGYHDEDYFLTVNDMPTPHWEALESCYHQGQCDEDCEFAKKYFDIKDYALTVNYLIDCGIERERFFDVYDDIDEDAVLSYYLWMLSGDFHEEGKFDEPENDEPLSYEEYLDKSGALKEYKENLK